MAATQEFYRIGGRLPRYTTKLTPFASGMYLTKQVIPEGFAKVMVNYDIDDTGSHIRPKTGRELVQKVHHGHTPGPLHLVDYLYAYNKDMTEVESTKDVIMSFGRLTTKAELFNEDPNNPATVVSGSKYNKPFYLSDMIVIKDTNLYEYDETIEDYKVVTPGEVTSYGDKSVWAGHYNKDKAQFEDFNLTPIGVGTIAARTIEGAYAFNKQVKNYIGRPISTVLNNELVTFLNQSTTFQKYTKNSERNEVFNLEPTTLSKIVLHHVDYGHCIESVPMEVKDLNPLEAAAYGFNLLSDNPYYFEDVKSSGLEELGIVMYEAGSNYQIPRFSPALGKPVTLRCYYGYPYGDDDIQIKFEWIDNTAKDAEWQVVKDWPKKVVTGEGDDKTETIEGGWIIKPGKPISIDYTPTLENTSVRFTARVGFDDATAVVIGNRSVLCGDSKQDALELKKFDLSSCKGMINWNGSLGVYGVQGATDTIFFSDINNPGYFPYPYNVLSFDNEVLAVHNYLDNLLVITVDSIWLVTPGIVISTAVQKRIMYNIHIPEIDAINAVVLKDQIFFKTDTQFYVLKPNQYTSDATDLKNYVNSTAIANYTSNFKEETVDLLNKVYRKVWQKFTKELRTQIRFEDFDVLDIHSELRNEEVHYIYTIKPILTAPATTDVKLDLHIIYNTLSRSWRLYLVLIGGDGVSYTPKLYKNKQSGEYYEVFAHDIYLTITKQTRDVVTDCEAVQPLKVYADYDNFQYLDTGNVSIDDTFTKRFREVQFNLANAEKTALDFYVDFKLEGQERVSATNYVIEHVTDRNDPQYGKIFVTPVEDDNMTLPGMTTLADDVSQSDHFAVDLSKFDALDVATIRFTLQGRGRRGAIQLLSTSLKRYELSDVNWVYRTMSAR